MVRKLVAVCVISWLPLLQGMPPAKPITVSAAVSLTDALTAVAAEYGRRGMGSVRAALAAVESGAADAAIVYRTDARIALRATVAWVVPADSGPRIVYPAAIIRTTSASDEAGRFLDFVRSYPAAQIFQRFGFQAVSAGSSRPPLKNSRRGAPAQAR